MGAEVPWVCMCSWRLVRGGPWGRGWDPGLEWPLPFHFGEGQCLRKGLRGLGCGSHPVSPPPPTRARNSPVLALHRLLKSEAALQLGRPGLGDGRIKWGLRGNSAQWH